MLSLQIIVQEIRLFFHHIWPALVVSAYTIAVWTLSRFVAKYQEQKRIISFMPQIVQDEVGKRDARITQLEATLTQAEERYADAMVVLRTVGNRAEAMRDLVLQHTPVQRLRLISRKEAAVGGR